MAMLRVLAWLFSTGLMFMASGIAFGQDYPNRPIRIVTVAVGGGSDFASRVLAQVLPPILGQTIVVDNRGNISGEIASKAQPDGYTLLMDGSSFWVGPLLQKASYDPVRDFRPITAVASTPNVVVIHASVAANSVKELIALAKAKPGALNYGSGGAGGTSHLAVELFKSMTGTNIVHVPYRGIGPAVGAMVGGEVQLLFGNVAAVMTQVKAGKLKALAVTSAQPSALAPGLSTVAASGLPGFESILVLGMFAPAKTPAAIVRRLNQQVVQVLGTADVTAKLFNAGQEVVASSPEEFAAWLQADLIKWSKVIKDAGIRVD